MGLLIGKAYELEVQRLRAAGRTSDPGVDGRRYVSDDAMKVSDGTVSSTAGTPSFRGVYAPGSIVILIGDSNSNGREPGTGSPGGRPDFASAFQYELVDSPDSLYYGCTIHNIAGNGSQIYSWKESITTGNQATNSSADAASIVNVWAAKNILALNPTKKGIIHVKLGTNEQWNSAFRSPGGVGVEATQLANFNTLVNWLIDNTSADLVLVIPQPIAFNRGINLGDWPNQAAADESSRIIRATYLNCDKRDHPRVRLVDTHGGLWGTAVTTAGTADYQNPTLNWYDDDLHLSAYGYRREQQYVANVVAGGQKIPRMNVRSSPDQALDTAVWSETIYMHSIIDQGSYAIMEVSYDPLFAMDGQTTDKPFHRQAPVTQLAYLKALRAVGQFGAIKRLTQAGGQTYRRMFCWCHSSGNVYSLGRLVVSQNVTATPGYWYAQITPEYQRDYTGTSGTAKFVAGDIGPITFWVEDAQYAPYARNETKTEVNFYAFDDPSVTPTAGTVLRHKLRSAMTDCIVYGYTALAPSGGTAVWQLYQNATPILPASIVFADGGTDATVTGGSGHNFAAGDLLQMSCTSNGGSGKQFHFQIVGKQRIF